MENKASFYPKKDLLLFKRKLVSTQKKAGFQSNKS